MNRLQVSEAALARLFMPTKKVALHSAQVVKWSSSAFSATVRCAAATLCWCAEVNATPLAIFDKSAERSCTGSELCDLTVSSRKTVGGYTGITLSRSGASKGRISVNPGRSRPQVQIDSEGEGVCTATLSWDGDPNARVLSGAGLGCFNFRASRGVAIIIKDLVAAVDCRDDAGSGVPCSDMIIESRLYDPSDPTGQTYSWSRIRRQLGEGSPRDLVIPFSNFLRNSPRGSARFECAGALTIAFKISGSSSVKLGMSALLIDDQYGAAGAPTPAVLLSPSPTSSPTHTPRPEKTGAVPPTSAPVTLATAVPSQAPLPPPARPTASQSEEERESAITTYGKVIQ